MKNVLKILILYLFSAQAAIATPQVATCTSIDDTSRYHNSLRTQIWERRLQLVDMREKQLEDELAAYIGEMVERAGYIIGYGRDPSDPKNFWEMKAGGLESLIPVYGNMGLAFIRLEGLMQTEDSRLKISELMPRVYGALLIHEYVQTKLLGRDARGEAAGILLRSYIAFDDSLSKLLRGQ